VEQKKRIGDRIISAFHAERVEASSVVVLFEPEHSDILLDGGLLFEAKAVRPPAEAPAPPPPPVAVQPPAAEEEPLPDFRTKVRRNRAELQALKARLVAILQARGALSSFQAQEELGLKSCEWAPATLRRFFSELEEEGMIVKQGQKRGTRYVWKGITGQQPGGASLPRLVKREEDPVGAQDW
jgi:hypothetical protein